MEAPIYLRPAEISDLIDGIHLVENRIYFEKSTDGHFEGPYVVHSPDTWIRDMFYRIIQQYVFVPHYEAVPDGMSCSMVFKEAEPGDLKAWDKLRYGYSYYLLINDRLSGPFLISTKTSVRELAAYLKDNRVYVLEHKSLQSFKDLQPSTIAS
jgi:hypothetical protein